MTNMNLSNQQNGASPDYIDMWADKPPYPGGGGGLSVTATSALCAKINTYNTTQQLHVPH